MITLAGVLLAAVFTVLGVLPVIALTRIGMIVGIGVLPEIELHPSRRDRQVRTITVQVGPVWSLPD